MPSLDAPPMPAAEVVRHLEVLRGVLSRHADKFVDADDKLTALGRAMVRMRQDALAAATDVPPTDLPPTLASGAMWRDVEGHARVCGVVLASKAHFAVMLRTRGPQRKVRRPFLYPVNSLLAGDDGWAPVSALVACDE